jgi:outer membrane protein assembly factor BamB
MDLENKGKDGFKTNWRHTRNALVLTAAFIVIIAGNFSSSPVFGEVIPLLGCPRAHCSPGNKDLAYLPPPGPNAEIVWHHNDFGGEKTGSYGGLGCSGNGLIAACTFRNSQGYANMIVYNYNGTRLWHSGFLLDSGAYASAPLILGDNEIIISDTQKVIRFGNDGSVIWRTDLPYGGLASSPVITKDGAVILASGRGPIYAVDSASGEILSTLFVRKSDTDPGYFDSVNTPALYGNRLYTLTQHQIDGVPSPDNLGRLIAIDIDRNAPDMADRLKVAWYYEYGADSRSSPLRIGDVILFEGLRPEPGPGEEDPHIFGVRDDGASATELWRKRLPSMAFVSFARDPRGGFWHFIKGGKWWIRRSVLTGDVLELINLDDLVAEPGLHSPTSAMTVTGDKNNPITLMGVADWSGNGDAYLIAVDMQQRNLLWKVLISPGSETLLPGQYPVLTNGLDTRVVFSSTNNGVWAVGEPAQLP